MCDGTKVVTAAIIDVAIPPTLEIENDDVMVNAGVNSGVTVAMTGMPKPTVTWYKVNKILIHIQRNFNKMCLSDNLQPFLQKCD